ncbi:MAG: hypothetical protein COT71_01400 [Candidatus Andersenbacteria bacterium CG10_big_fil_rev_8_21_14_0_10_54_11]|uniref:DoxX family protein n=1 Tax=Candidatus Andersenbacteria bacterium CG10_big_fil_rev_8_21_14_0_10_54_11 TaxID=1974485 RepID=A0A2M6WZX4_9BACT|nr:MAG: hypothetical protein COT71_01400 [Candidatus Andersenbacteria bacterium CG10_big_fil_rev_8_21_14_0_10_54_11]
MASNVCLDRRRPHGPAIRKRQIRWFAAAVTALVPAAAAAHEAYVVEQSYFWEELHRPFSTHAVDALKDPHNTAVTAYITVGVLLLLTANFLFRRTRFGRTLHAYPERFARFGPMFVRAAIAGALFFSAASNSFLGPELSINHFAHPGLFRIGLLLISIMFAVGFLTELAAAIGLLLYAGAAKIFGAYVLTYANYLGELIVLLLFGMRRWSLDAAVFGKLSRVREQYEKYESVIVRMLYGFALVFAGITVKFLHPDITIKVATDWHLTQFHWLFPSDSLLITFGAGLAEVAIGMFIILGFEMRLTVVISLFYITLSLLYFRELVWPHYLLYGISLNLLVQPETFTIDHVLFARHRRRTRWWRRPFLPHHGAGKSIGKKLRPEKAQPFPRLETI